MDGSKMDTGAGAGIHRQENRAEVYAIAVFQIGDENRSGKYQRSYLL